MAISLFKKSDQESLDQTTKKLIRDYEKNGFHQVAKYLLHSSGLGILNQQNETHQVPLGCSNCRRYSTARYHGPHFSPRSLRPGSVQLFFGIQERLQHLRLSCKSSPDPSVGSKFRSGRHLYLSASDLLHTR